ncbi:MAG: 50S ribosomal protein L4 [Parcubacteria group bacterium CG_4_10_14_0_2_um_filter_7_35_8]|nr:MAG: 50S ribosomal protein L4 [Parcubacteria group bacterium CG23_combo_of_CG06-09_8_20_14_all_35_6]PIR58542.1 MAG: 50S ribosomal protein L4 [Parcubacteria group bacterium CG10_big_fil_rev_8_21_14_0_10_35_15]PIZ76460.1 MAG: 50S ribosomal protein L4 [Parcubacteria group bacterium CG_4_10_14_0_2_um_filter_7_35_8]
MFVKTYNQNGEESGKALLPKDVFELKPNSDLLWQITRSQMANQRQGSAHTKTRGEVSGGGKKPWRQKGTGRSRHSSIRSPLWKGGGTIFGPRNEKIWKQGINKKMARKSLLVALSSKAKEKELIVLETLKIDQPKTKQMAGIINDLRLKIADFKKSKVLIILAKPDKNIVLASRNIPGVETIDVRNINTLEILSFKYLLMTKETISELKKTFSKNENAE